jgi:hypothetical protein
MPIFIERHLAFPWNHKRHVNLMNTEQLLFCEHCLAAVMSGISSFIVEY